MRALMILALAVSACGSSESEPSQSQGAVARDGVGKVVEIGGTVTATRDGKVRTLAVGNPIDATDTIDTGKDGSITIELFHNNARWSLESGIRTRVDESVAWAMSKQELAKVPQHSTTAAGRHGDREAAQTEVTGGGPAAAAAPTVEAPKADPKVEPPPNTAPKAQKPTVGATPKDALPTKPAQPCDEVSCVMDGSAPCCAKFKKSGGGKLEQPSASELPDAPDRQAILAGINAVRGRITACAAKDSAKGVLKLTIRIGADGKVASVEVKQSVSAPIDQCAAAVLKTATFPRSKTGTSVSYPITIN